MSTNISRIRVGAERDLQRGEIDRAFRRFLAAGDAARRDARWLLAARCYRDALELDLGSRVAVRRLIAIGRHTRDRSAWIDYAHALERDPYSSGFSCRGAQLLVHNLGAVVQCVEVGPVLDLLMTSDSSFDCLPDGRFRDMPVAMSMLVLRRALWPDGRSKRGARVRVTYRGHVVWLNPRGEWFAADLTSPEP